MTDRRLLPFVSALALFALGIASAHAAAPFGVGLPEPPPSGGGFLPGLFHWIAAEQKSFYRALTETVRAMKADGSAGLVLAGLSFAYGVLHAAGPGHGKAIISAYVLANRETARNAAILSVLSALAQAVTAVVVVSVLTLALGATSMAMTATAEALEIGSFALIAGLGLLLVWRKILVPARAFAAERYAPVVFASVSTLALAGPHAAAREPAVSGASATTGRTGQRGLTYTPSVRATAPAHVHGPDCGCGHTHGPTAEVAAQPLNWRSAWSTIVAVGLRPCTGALIVLVFAASQGLFAAGVASTFAMALGTGLTVAAITLAAVLARETTLRFSGASDGATARTAHRVIEAAGALVVLAFGLVMLGASLSG